MKKLLNIIALLSISACAPVLAQEGGHHMPPKETTTCGAENLQYLVGQNRKVLQTMRFGQIVRFEEPGYAYTMEYRADRLRIVIGEDGKIKRVLCG
jgi:hypothetical protein